MTTSAAGMSSAVMAWVRKVSLSAWRNAARSASVPSAAWRCVQAVDVFFEHRLAIEPLMDLDQLLFRRRVGGIWHRQAALLPTWIAAGQQ